MARGMPPDLLMVFSLCFISSSLSALEDLEWLPLNHTFSRVSEMVPVGGQVSLPAFLQESGAAGHRYGHLTAYCDISLLYWLNLSAATTELTCYSKK